MTYAQAAATYQRNAVLTASPEKLVKLLYEGAIKNLEKSQTRACHEFQAEQVNDRRALKQHQ